MIRPRRSALVTLIAAIAAACTSSAPAVPVASSLVVGIVGEPASLLGDDPVGRIVAGALVEPLVRRTATEELEPRLAASVPTFASGDLAVVEGPDAPAGRLVATFQLRDALVWHDGRPLTADDVRFAFETDRVAPIGSEARALAERIDRVDVLDRLRVRVAYRAGERWELYALAPRALPRHLLEGAGAAARAQYASRPVHAGPYRVSERVPGRITLDAFPDHVLGRAQIDRIVVRAYADRAALLSAMRQHDVDVAPSPGFDADLAATLDRSADGRSLQVLYTQAQAIAMLRFGPRLAGPLVREAASLTIDRERIARSVFAGRVRVPASYLVAPLWAATTTLGPPRVDRPAARSLLERAGFRRGNFGIVERGGDRLVVTLVVPSGAPGMAEAARGVAVDLATLGIAVDVSERDAAEVDARILRGDFDLALLIERAEDPFLATERYRGAVSSWFDVLADAARDAADHADKRALYTELQRLWSDAMPALPLYQVLKVDVVPARLEGVRPAAHGAPLTWNVGEWRPAPGR